MRRDAEYTMFVQTRSSALLRVARLLAPDWAIAEDLLQTALIKLYVHWPKIGHGGAEAYARRCLVTTAIDDTRRPWRRERPTDTIVEHSADDVTLARVEHLGELLPALARLPARQRAAVVLRHYLDLSDAQAADVLGCSVGTVKSNTSRGLAALRKAAITPALVGDQHD